MIDDLWCEEWIFDTPLARFEEEDIAVSLGDELPDSLRNVTPAVELLEERFKNMQRRNILEPRLKHK